MATRYGGAIELVDHRSTSSAADGASRATRGRGAASRSSNPAQRQAKPKRVALCGGLTSFSQPAPPRFFVQPAEINLTLRALTAMLLSYVRILRNIFSSWSASFQQYVKARAAPAASSETFAHQMALGSEARGRLVRRRSSRCTIDAARHLASQWLSRHGRKARQQGGASAASS